MILLLQQDSFSKYRPGGGSGNFSTGLLSASELEELSTTDTEASESETEVSSAADPLAGSMSAGSSSTSKRETNHSNRLVTTALAHPMLFQIL